MTICFGKICSFGILCLSIMKVYQLRVYFFPFSLRGWYVELNQLIPYHCLFFTSECPKLVHEFL